ncbi:LysR Transcriptional regulator [Rhabdaerophilaceae bacterium]
MEMHQVRYFLAVARTLNFTRAAEHCNVAQPSLTRAIQNLENELGGQLFHRERQNTQLTDLGRAMLPHLEQTFNAAMAARELARAIKAGESAPIKVGVSSALAPDTLMNVFEDLRTNVTGLELTLRHAPDRELCDAVLAGQHDVVFVSDRIELPDRMRGWPLFRGHVRLIIPAGHGLASREEIDIIDLEDECLIDLADFGGREYLMSICPEAEGVFRFRHCAHAVNELQALVLSGFGLGLLCSSVPPIPGLVARPLAIGSDTRRVMVAIVAGRPFNRATELCLRLARNRDWQTSVGHHLVANPAMN